MVIGLVLDKCCSVRHDCDVAVSRVLFFVSENENWSALHPQKLELQEYVLWNAVSVPLLQFAR